MHYENRIGHIGGNLSALDTIMLLHHRVLGSDDVFVLSKGHSAGALYVTLWTLGHIDEEHLRTFHQDGSKLAGHPVAGWQPRISFSTGSLGHGQGLAAGVALGKKIANSRGRVFCLLSDGEWEEGSNWESLLFVAHHQLVNLTLLIDANGLQGFGTTAEVASLEPLAEKIRAFGIHVEEIDGHDLQALESALSITPGRPLAVLLRTVKGKGVSFMENAMEWHYLPMTEAQYLKAQQEIAQS
jgi:transketolase